MEATLEVWMFVHLLLNPIAVLAFSRCLRSGLRLCVFLLILSYAMRWECSRKYRSCVAAMFIFSPFKFSRLICWQSSSLSCFTAPLWIIVRLTYNCFGGLIQCIWGSSCVITSQQYLIRFEMKQNGLIICRWLWNHVQHVKCLWVQHPILCSYSALILVHIRSTRIYLHNYSCKSFVVCFYRLCTSSDWNSLAISQ